MMEHPPELLRQIYSLRDFELARSSLSFFFEAEESESYSKADLRRFRSYVDAATMSYCRPFTRSKGLPIFKRVVWRCIWRQRWGVWGACSSSSRVMAHSQRTQGIQGHSPGTLFFDGRRPAKKAKRVLPFLRKEQKAPSATDTEPIMSSASSAMVRVNSLTLNGTGDKSLPGMDKHGKRLDQTSKQNIVRDVPPLVFGSLNLREAYDAHMEGVKQNAGTKRPVMHALVRWPTAWEITPDSEQRMLDWAVEFIDGRHGGKAVFAARLDRDEQGQHVVDVFYTPKYLKETAETRRGNKKPEWWASTTKHGKEMALEHQDYIKSRHPTAKGDLKGPRHVGIALQVELETFLRVRGFDVQPRKEKVRSKSDHVPILEWKAQRALDEAEAYEAWTRIAKSEASKTAMGILKSAQEDADQTISDAQEQATSVVASGWKTAEGLVTPVLLREEAVETREKAVKAREAAVVIEDGKIAGRKQAAEREAEQIVQAARVQGSADRSKILAQAKADADAAAADKAKAAAADRTAAQVALTAASNDRIQAAADRTAAQGALAAASRDRIQAAADNDTAAGAKATAADFAEEAALDRERAAQELASLRKERDLLATVLAGVQELMREVAPAIEWLRERYDALTAKKPPAMVKPYEKALSAADKLSRIVKEIPAPAAPGADPGLTPAQIYAMKKALDGFGKN